MTTLGTGAFTDAGSLTSSTNWDTPRSKGHSVQFYEDESFLLEGLSRFIGAAIAAGDSAVVIATKAHRDGLRDRLANSGLDLAVASKQGRFLSLDAAETLAQFMVDGHPDSSLFENAVGPIISQLAAAEGKTRRVAAFGEMVALLWAEGNQEAALQLERLWNQLSEKHTFQLHCAYPMNLFRQARDGEGLKSICSEHSHIVPAERYTALQSDEERFGTIAVLQHKAQALETEINEREKIQAVLQKRESELSDFLENAVVAMHWVAADGTILWANKAELALLGYERDEYFGHHIAEFHADGDVIDDILKRLGRQEELHGCNARLRCKDGSIRHVRVDSNVYTEHGKFIHTRCFTIDVTDRQKTEQRIAAQYAITRLLSEASTLKDVTESLLETICDSSDCDMGAVWLVEGDVLRCVKTWHRSTNQFPEFERVTVASSFRKGVGLPGRIWATNEPAWIPDIGVDGNLPRRSFALEDGIRSAFGFPISTSKGPLGIIEFFSRQIKEKDAEFMRMMAAVGNQVGQFIERKQAEQALRESEERNRAIIETTPECVKIVAADGTLLHMNSAGLTMVGAGSLDVVAGRSVYDLIAPEDRESFTKFNERICRGERGSLEFDIVGLQGVRRNMETRAAPLRNADGSIVQLALTRDITLRRESQEAERRLAAIVESSDDAIASKDLNGIVTSWNRSAERLFGYKAEEIIGKAITLIIPPELQQDEQMILGKIRRGEKIDHFETVRLQKNGERIDVSLTISPVRDEFGNVIGAAKIIRNITENKKIAQALRTTEKLAAAGRLAATIAHEINNPLEAVTNLVYLAKRDLSNNPRVAGYLELANRELDRVAHIARQTLGFYRDTSAPMHFSITQTLDDLLFLYEKRLESRNIKVLKQYDRNIEITALAGEVRQAFSNLITNAIDAMPAGGKLIIRVSRSHRWNNSHLAGVRITILDTGSGIALEHRKNLFQPFFTTKADIGTGLGLWITRSIVEKHRGLIQVKSRTRPNDQGTAFSILLPSEAKIGSPEAWSIADASGVAS